MFRVALEKLLTFVLFLLLISIVVFLMARLSPMDPLATYFGESLERMSEEQKLAAAERLSLNDPLPLQYFSWLQNALVGDLGLSEQYKQPVIHLIDKFWLNTLLLGGIAFVLSFVLATAIGGFCAIYAGSIIDKIICRLGSATAMIPSFFIALIAILIFAVNLKLLPTGGAYSLGGGDLVDRMLHLILPVSVLVASHLWYYAYMIRNRLIEELGRDYVLLLRSKRISRPHIVFRHALKNSLPTLITLMAISVPHIITGTYVVEMVFGYPGLGTLTFESAQYRDFNLLAALTLLTGTIVLVCNMAGQSLSELFDLRMRTKTKVVEVGSAQA